MSDQRHLKVHFNDGTMLHFEVPPRDEDSLGASQRAESILEQRHLVIEADGTLLMFPITSIKYVEIYPSPRNLPGTVVRGARLVRPDS
jgi:hypothetical protein